MHFNQTRNIMLDWTVVNRFVSNNWSLINYGQKDKLQKVSIFSHVKVHLIDKEKLIYI